mgnify:CR=1 FL=1
MGFFDFFQGDGFGAATETGSAVIDDVNGQEALGQAIIEAELHRQSEADLDAANQRATDSFQAYYEDATAGPAYDPFADDPYHGLTQETLGRAIVQQAQGQHALDDSPLEFLKSADIGAWADVVRQVPGLVNPGAAEQPISGAPRQIFPNRPGQGQGFQISPARLGSAPTGGGVSPLLILGVVAVGVYLASK